MARSRLDGRCRPRPARRPPQAVTARRARARHQVLGLPRSCRRLCRAFARRTNSGSWRNVPSRYLGLRSACFALPPVCSRLHERRRRERRQHRYGNETAGRRFRIPNQRLDVAVTCQMLDRCTAARRFRQRHAERLTGQSMANASSRSRATATWQPERGKPSYWPSLPTTTVGRSPATCAAIWLPTARGGWPGSGSSTRAIRWRSARGSAAVAARGRHSSSCCGDVRPNRALNNGVGPIARRRPGPWDSLLNPCKPIVGCAARTMPIPRRDTGLPAMRRPTHRGVTAAGWRASCPAAGSTSRRRCRRMDGGPAC
ncbi:hypothetical protein CUTA107171_27320 [Cupriavidus taiwanensis]